MDGVEQSDHFYCFHICMVVEMDWLFLPQPDPDTNCFGGTGIFPGGTICGGPADWIRAMGGRAVLGNNGNSLAIAHPERGRCLKMRCWQRYREIKISDGNSGSSFWKHC